MNHFFTALAILLISLVFIFMGINVILRKKPLIFHSRWFLLLFILIFIPQIINIIKLIDFNDPITLVIPVMYPVLIVFLAFAFKGHIIFGVNCDDFQNKFIELLNNKNIKFEQSFSKLILTEHNVEINIALQAWIGSGQLKLKGKNNPQIFRDIIQSLKTADIKSKLITPIFYIILGLLMSLIGLFLLRLIDLT